jgi:2-polyprenyl-3-methyl-5-hydroxy-6-metoxy-1,4-benzoquinol methylase
MRRIEKQEHWDAMYMRPIDAIPWEISASLKELQQLVGQKVITGGMALDVGCGTGNYSFYLASNGLNVTGAAFSEKALEIGRKHNESLRLPVNFKLADVTKLLDVLRPNSFNFILDYSILHHIELDRTDSYAQQFPRLLKKMANSCSYAIQMKINMLKVIRKR